MDIGRDQRRIYVIPETPPVRGLPRARDQLNHDLASLSSQRRHLQDRADSLALEIAARATYLRDHLGQSKARSAEIAGISPSHLTEWMTRARADGVEVDDPLERIPWLNGRALRDYVATHAGIARIIAAFDDTDVVMTSGINPVGFLDQGSLRHPHLLIECGDGAHVAVDRVQVGYGGTGPSNTIDELQGIGVSDDIAYRIAHNRYSNVTFDDHNQVVDEDITSEWPRDHTGGVTPHRDGFVALLSLDGYTRAPTPDEDSTEETYGGFYPTTPERTRLRAWLDLLTDASAPDWMRGDRRVRVYFGDAAAIRDGFTEDQIWGGDNPSRLVDVFTLIIEQGLLQLWVLMPEPADTRQRFPAELYPLLDELGFYDAVDALDPASQRSSFVRWISSLGRVPPPFVDLENWPLTRVYPTPTNQLAQWEGILSDQIQQR